MRYFIDLAQLDLAQLDNPQSRINLTRGMAVIISFDSAGF
jgi:hypothetical protein